MDHPLIPIGDVSDFERTALAEAVQRYQDLGDTEALAPLEHHLQAFPGSPYRASLRTGLGLAYRHLGYFSKALESLEAAWRETRDDRTPAGKFIRGRAGAEYIELLARLGQVSTLEQTLQEFTREAVQGVHAEAVSGAQAGLWSMKQKPERAFRCGPLGLAMLASDPETRAKLLEEPCTPMGTHLAHNEELARRYGLGFQMARREAGAPFAAPALLHWKAGHFAALVKEESGRYLIKDPTFGEEFWMSRAALEAESSGYALIREGALPRGWTAVPAAEGRGVWGKGDTANAFEGNVTPCDHKSGGDASCQGGSGCDADTQGMPRYAFHTAVVSLNIQDTPVGYRPPVGPAVNFTVVYNQRATGLSAQPLVINGIYVGPPHSNMGSQWTHNWASYVVDDPGPQGAGKPVSLAVRGGGRHSYTGYQSELRTYAPQFKTRDFLSRPKDDTYQVTRPDGSVLVYAASDGAKTYPRRIYLSEVRDVAGNTVRLTWARKYPVTLNDAITGFQAEDPSAGYGHPAGMPSTPVMMLERITDAVGQVTRFEHDGFLRVTKVTDPFGRQAAFGYDSGQLSQSTDVAGLISRFRYGYVNRPITDFTLRVSGSTGTPNPNLPGGVVVFGDVQLPDFLTSMTTPYGTTTFSMYEDGTFRALVATDPLGNQERLEFRHTAPDVPYTDPVGVTGHENNAMNYRNSYFWNKQVYAQHGRDYAKAVVRQWLHGLDGEFGAPVPESEKHPLENRLWYTSEGNTGGLMLGTSAKITGISRATGSGQQDWAFTYNPMGKPLTVKDPLGRATTFKYAANLIDLLETRQTGNGANDLLGTFTYNDTHLPLTATDASGQVTRFTYNGRGQVTSVVNPKGESTTLTYDGDGHLTGIQGNAPASKVTFEHDALGRVNRVTDAEGRSVHTEYDVFDRPTRVDFPDGSYEENRYDRLDLGAVRDRKGQWTFMSYNPLRQLTEVRDAMGRVTSLNWCTCGSLESLRDPLGHTTNWVRDVQGRVTSKVLPDRTHVDYQYDAAGRLSQRKDALGQITRYTYGLDNQIAGIAYAETRHSTPGVSYSYDTAYPRLIKKAHGLGTVSYAYNPVSTPPALGAGRLAQEEGPFPNSTRTYKYDQLGRIVERTSSGATESRVFDAMGRLQSLSGPLGTFSYAYDGVTPRLASVALPNGLTSTFQYASGAGDFRLRSIEHKKASGSLVSAFAYTHDVNGQIESWSRQTDVEGPRVQSFTYDPAGQLLQAATKDAAGALLGTYLYGYDAAGNRTSEVTDTQATSSEHNEANQLVKQRGSSPSAPIAAPRARSSRARRTPPPASAPRAEAASARPDGR